DIGAGRGISLPGLMKLYPFCLLALALFCWFVLRPRWQAYARQAVLALCGLHIAGGLVTVAATFANPSYASREIEQKIIDTIGLDKTFGGDYAPFFAKSSRLRALYMRPDFNTPEDVTT